MKTLYILIAVIFILVLFGLVIYYTSQPNQPIIINNGSNLETLPIQSLIIEAISNNAIVVQSIKGRTSINYQDALISLSAPEKRNVGKDAQIKTMAQSQSLLIYPNGTILTMEENSEVLIGENKNETTSESNTISLLTGNLWSRITQIANKTNTFEVLTPNSKITVHGTTILTKVKTDLTKLFVNEAITPVDFLMIDTNTKKPISGGKVSLSQNQFIEANSNLPPTKTDPLKPASILASDLADKFYQNSFANDELIRSVIHNPDFVNALKKARPNIILATNLENLVASSTSTTIAQNTNSTSTQSSTSLPTQNQDTLKISTVTPSIISRNYYGFVNNKITVKGVGLTGITQLKIGATLLSNFSVIDDYTIEATVPDTINPGTYDISVKNDTLSSLINQALIIQ